MVHTVFKFHIAKQLFCPFERLAFFHTLHECRKHDILNRGKILEKIVKLEYQSYKGSAILREPGFIQAINLERTGRYRP
jgi:hypothetical protein